MGNFNGPVAGAQTTATIYPYDPVNDVILAGQPTSGGVTVKCQGLITNVIPAERTRRVPCGLNSGAYTIGAMTQLGMFGLEALDFTNNDALRQFNGVRCMVNLQTYAAGERIYSEWIVDWTPSIKINIPKGDGERTIDLQNESYLYYYVDYALGGSSSNNYYFGNAETPPVTETT